MENGTIEPVTAVSFPQAVRVYRASWQASHRELCTPAFLESRDCARYLRREQEAGKALYLLTDGEPVGIVSVYENTIENLYVTPRLQGKGYGTELLRFAMGLCGSPRLTVLSSNVRAIALYRRMGFRETGKRMRLREDLWELEMGM